MSLLPCKKILKTLVCAATVCGFLSCPADLDQELSQSSRTVSLLGQHGWNAENFEAERVLAVEEGTIFGAPGIVALGWNILRGEKVFADFGIAPERNRLDILSFRAEGRVWIRCS